MTVQSLGQQLSKSLSSWFLDDLLLNYNNDGEVPFPACHAVGEDCYSCEKSLLNLQVPQHSKSPDLDGEDAFNFVNLDEKPINVLPSSSIIQAPIYPVTGIPHLVNMGDQLESGIPHVVKTGDQLETVGTSPGTSRPSLVTSGSPMATRLRTGTQLRRPVTSPDSLSGSSSSSPRYEDDGEKSQLDDLPEMKFKKGKRKKDVDLDAIDDPDERRKQRRLAKNRATAALSRERKRNQMATLIERVRIMDATHASLKGEIARLQREVAMKDEENMRLRGELASHTSGVGGATESEVSALAREPAVLSGASPAAIPAADVEFEDVLDFSTVFPDLDDPLCWNSKG
eukprot:jgi/Botrbrau1/20108/Bobra.0173s0011.1